MSDLLSLLTPGIVKPVAIMQFCEQSIRSLGIDVLNTGTTVMYYPIIGQQNIYTVYGDKSEHITA